MLKVAAFNKLVLDSDRVKDNDDGYVCLSFIPKTKNGRLTCHSRSPRRSRSFPMEDHSSGSSDFSPLSPLSPISASSPVLTSGSNSSSYFFGEDMTNLSPTRPRLSASLSSIPSPTAHKSNESLMVKASSTASVNWENQTQMGSAEEDVFMNSDSLNGSPLPVFRLAPPPSFSVYEEQYQEGSPKTESNGAANPLVFVDEEVVESKDIPRGSNASKTRSRRSRSSSNTSFLSPTERNSKSSENNPGSPSKDTMQDFGASLGMTRKESSGSYPDVFVDPNVIDYPSSNDELGNSQSQSYGAVASRGKEETATPLSFRRYNSNRIGVTKPSKFQRGGTRHDNRPANFPKIIFDDVPGSPRSVFVDQDVLDLPPFTRSQSDQGSLNYSARTTSTDLDCTPNSSLSYFSTLGEDNPDLRNSFLSLPRRDIAGSRAGSIYSHSSCTTESSAVSRTSEDAELIHTDGVDESDARVDGCIDCCTCMCCFKALAYHYGKDQDNESWVYDPCSCSGTRRSNAKRWALLSLFTCCMPCLIFYLPLKGCQKAAARVRRFFRKRSRRFSEDAL